MARRNISRFSERRRVWAEEVARRRGYNSYDPSWDLVFWAILLTNDGPDIPQDYEHDDLDTAVDYGANEDSFDEAGGGSADDFGSDGGTDFGSASYDSPPAYEPPSVSDSGGGYDSGGGGSDFGGGGDSGGGF